MALHFGTRIGITFALASGTAVAAGMRDQVANRNQRLELAIQEEMPSVWADPARWAQVLTAVLDNALKFTQEGARVAITVQGVENEVGTTVRFTLPIWDAGKVAEHHCPPKSSRASPQSPGETGVARGGTAICSVESR